MRSHNWFKNVFWPKTEFLIIPPPQPFTPLSSPRGLGARCTARHAVRVVCCTNASADRMKIIIYYVIRWVWLYCCHDRWFADGIKIVISVHVHNKPRFLDTSKLARSNIILLCRYSVYIIIVGRRIIVVVCSARAATVNYVGVAGRIFNNKKYMYIYI